jgi:tetratricopeptide (TPR) repeat protein
LERFDQEIWLNSTALLSTPIHYLKLSVGQRSLLRISVEHENNDILTHYFDSLSESERHRIIALAVFDKNMPISVELLKFLWDFASIDDVQEQTTSLISKGVVLVGYGPESIQLRDDLHVFLYERLHTPSYSGHKLHFETSMKRYLKSRSSFLGSQFLESELQQIVECWRRLDFSESDFEHYWQVVDEVVAIGDTSEEFVCAENMLLLMATIHDGNRDRVKRCLDAICRRKLSKFGQSVEHISALSKYIYLAFDVDDVDDTISSYYKELVSVFGSSNSSFYPHLLAVVSSRYFSRGMYSRMLEIMVEIISSSEFDSNKYLPIPSLFLVQYVKCLIASGGEKAAGKLAATLSSDCPKRPFYSLVNSFFDELVADTYELKNKFNKSRVIRERILEELVNEYGHYHPLSISATENLCSLCLKSKSLELLEPLLAQLLQCQRRVYGENSQNCISTVIKIAAAQKGRGELNKAIDFLKTELNNRRANTDCNYFDLVPLMDELGHFCVAANALKDAHTIFKRLCAILEDSSKQALSPELRLVKARALFHVGSSFFLSQKLEKAKDFYFQSSKILFSLLSHLGEARIAEDIGRVLMCLGEILYSSNDYRGAIENLDRSLKFLRISHSDDEPMMKEIIKCKESAEKALDAISNSLVVDLPLSDFEHLKQVIIEQEDEVPVSFVPSEAVASGDLDDDNSDIEFYDPQDFPSDAPTELADLKMSSRNAEMACGSLPKEADDVLSTDGAAVSTHDISTEPHVEETKRDNTINSRPDECDLILSDIPSVVEASPLNFDAEADADVDVDVNLQMGEHHIELDGSASFIADEIHVSDPPPEPPRYCNLTSFDVFFYSAYREPADQIRFDSDVDINGILDFEHFPLFVYDEHRQNCSSHARLLKLDGISYVYTASTCDLLSMFLDQSSGRVVAVRPNEDSVQAMGSRSVSQAVGEIYLCPRDGIQWIDNLYGFEYVKTPVKVR